MGGGGRALDRMSASRLERLSRLNSSMTRVVLVIVVMFGVCQFPYHVMEVTSLVVIDRMEQKPPQLLSPTTAQALIYCNVVVQILVFLSSCCNPIVYGILNKNYRKSSIPLLMARGAAVATITSDGKTITKTPQLCKVSK